MMKKNIVLGSLAVVAVVTIAFLAMSKTSLGDSLHARSHDLGVCQVDHTVANSAAAGCNSGAGCSLSAQSFSSGRFTDVERRVIDYFCDRIVAEGTAEFQIDEVAKGTGLSKEVLGSLSLAKLQPAVLAELNRRNVNLSDLGGPACGNCSQFSACSVDRDLSGATGEELQRYQLEKSQDGTTFTDWRAPDFTLPTTAGDQVSLSEYRGKPVALVFLSGHCSHSFDTLPILSELKQKYQKQGLIVLPVYVNSGSVADVKSWSSRMDLSFPLVVSQNKAISGAYGSRMVPSTFLIDRKGRVTKKYVGYKDRKTLDQAFQELVRSRS